MISASGACYGWMIDHTPGSVQLTYGVTAYSGPVAGLASASLTSPSLGPQSFNLALTVRDVSAPVPLALPRYYGMFYIVFAFFMAAIWVFSLGPFLLFGIPLIWVSVRCKPPRTLAAFKALQLNNGSRPFSLIPAAAPFLTDIIVIAVECSDQQRKATFSVPLHAELQRVVTESHL